LTFENGTVTGLKSGNQWDQLIIQKVQILTPLSSKFKKTKTCYC